MSQSWDTEHQQHAMYNRVPVSTVRMRRWKQHRTFPLWCRPHPSLQAKSSYSNSQCNGDVLTPLERRIYHQTMTKCRHRLSLRSRLVGLLSRPVETQGACAARLSSGTWCISVALGLGNSICAHGTILTNRESSQLVGERIFYALQVRTRTI